MSNLFDIFKNDLNSKIMKISIVIPVFNEAKTIIQVLDKIHLATNSINHKFEIIIVNDGSTDKTKDNLIRNKHLYDQLINIEKNMGKGNALNLGFSKCSGEVIIIQDADLEYSPEDYPKLLSPFEKFDADIVYGSRFRTSDISAVLLFWHTIANKIITLTSNIFSDLNLSDVETGYKVFKKKLINDIKLNEKRFGIEIELTHKFSNLIPKPKIYEVGISYNGRTYMEGKKIGVKDAFRAIYCILKYAFIEKK